MRIGNLKTRGCVSLVAALALSLAQAASQADEPAAGKKPDDLPRPERESAFLTARLTLPSLRGLAFADWQLGRSSGVNAAGFWRARELVSGSRPRPNELRAIPTLSVAVIWDSKSGGSPMPLLDLQAEAADEALKRTPYLGTELQPLSIERDVTDDERSVADSRPRAATELRF